MIINNLIKFRVWDKLEKRMIYPDSPGCQHYIIDLNGRFHNLQNGSGGDDYIVQRFTGLKDKDNNDVYEGDIVYARLSSNVVDKTMAYFVVGYNSSYSAFVLNDLSPDRLVRTGRWTWICNLSSNGKVVGNMFEDRWQYLTKDLR